MSVSKVLKREAEVAFSKHTQPIWWRTLKYLLLIILIWSFWGTILLWAILAALFTVGLILHFWFRYKTSGWTKSYGMWDYEKNKPKEL